MSAYEWEEEVPQPKPPTRRVALMVHYDRRPITGHGETTFNSRPATQADIARALEVTEHQLEAFLKNPNMSCTRPHYDAIAIQGQGQSLNWGPK